MNQLQTLRKSPALDGFETPTLDEIVCLWQSFRATGLEAEEAWNAIVAGLALEIAFPRRPGMTRIEQ